MRVNLRNWKTLDNRPCAILQLTFFPEERTDIPGTVLYAERKAQMGRVCAACGRGGIHLKCCSRCKDKSDIKVWYCNRECQVMHFPQHNAVCTR